MNEWPNVSQQREEKSVWQARQGQMEEWYRQVATRANSADDLYNEYLPFAPFLGQLRGTILDVGGGIGLIREFLRNNSDYFVIDPSMYWLVQDWTSLSSRFPSVKGRPLFVRGLGENLPFAACSFDAVVSFWSLNHCFDPISCVLEMHRVVKPQGKALLVLEDMEPSWWDGILMCWRDVQHKCGYQSRVSLDWRQVNIATGKQTIKHKLSMSQWPLQSDHKRVYERELYSLFRRRFRLISRSWNGGYLHFQLEKM